MELHSLDWLTTLIQALPQLPRPRKTIYDLAGFPRWEAVASNMLAFYLDEEEEHRFKRLFFDALVNLLLAKGALATNELEIFQTGYTIEREVQGSGGRIDILLTSTEGRGEKAWAIIIENKLDASLYNDLVSYWTETKAVRRLGVVLSLTPNHREVAAIHKKTGILYHNVLHSELATAIRKGLPDIFMVGDDRHLLFLKDYLQNIENMTQPVNQVLIEKQLALYREAAEKIEALKEVEKGLKDYTVSALFRAMATLGFVPGTGYTNVKAKHFYPDPDFFTEKATPFPEGLRFWLWIEDLVAYGQISVVFELYDKFTKLGPELRARLQKDGLVKPPSKIGQNGGENYGYFHLVNIDHLDLTAPGKFLEEQMVQMMKLTYFNEEYNVVELSTKWVSEELMKENIPGTS